MKYKYLNHLKTEKNKNKLSWKSYYSVPAHPNFCSITDLLTFLLSALLHCKNYEANHQITIYNEEGPKSLWVRIP